MGKICPKCGNELSDGARFCSKCGSKYEEVATVKDNMCKCSKCGNELKIGMKFCTKCGTPINDLEKAGQDVNVVEKSKEFTGDVKNFKTLPKKRKKKVAIIIGIIVAALFLMFSCVGGDEDERGIDKNTFEKRFCEDIGVSYSSDDWAIDNTDSDSSYIIEAYYGEGGLSVLLYLDGEKVAAACVVADMAYYNIDEEFMWKCAAVDAMLECSMNEADEIVREVNASGTLTEIEDGIKIDPSVSLGNLSGFFIATEDYEN